MWATQPQHAELWTLLGYHNIMAEYTYTKLADTVTLLKLLDDISIAIGLEKQLYSRQIGDVVDGSVEFINASVPNNLKFYLDIALTAPELAILDVLVADHIPKPNYVSSLYIPSLDSSIKWIKINKSYVDFQTSVLINNIELFVIPEGTTIHGIITKHSNSFLGGLISDYTISVGIPSDLTKYTVPFSVFTIPSNTNFQLSENFYIENWGASTSIRAQSISTGANLDQATQGEVEFYILVSNPKS